MKRTLIALAVMSICTGASAADVGPAQRVQHPVLNCDPGTKGSLDPKCGQKPTQPPVQVGPISTSAQAVSISSADANAEANASGGSAVAYGAPGGNVELNVQGPRASQAPDVITYPTAPCRISVGVSAGWFTGNFGVGSSVEDEGCTLRENSRMLHNLGQQSAALQIMCLDDRARQALEATGTKCLIAKPAPQEAIKP